MEVCRVTWMDTFKISKGVVEKLRQHLQNRTIFVKDQRGKHENHFTNPVGLINRMENQIRQYPRYQSHYSRREKEFYLSPDLNLSKMFRQFVAENPNIPEVERKENIYINVFQSTKLKIGVPKSDTCSECDQFKIRLSVATNAQIEELTRDRDEHQMLADEAYKALNEDIGRSRRDNSVVVKCGDLQKVLFTPTLTHKEMYYRRQLSTYNFCLYDGARDNSNMFLWSEAVGNRGVDEMGSCILRNILEEQVPLVQGQQRTLIFWSDRCRGQNNNFQLLSLFKYLIQRRFFTTIEQKFLHTGHSFLPCDRHFALIESNKRTATAMVPEDWIDIVRSTRITQPFNVQDMTQQHIMRISTLEDVIPRPPHFLVTQHMRYFMNDEHPHLIFSRDDFLVGPWLQPFTIYRPNNRQRFVNRPVWTHADLNGFVLRQKYHAPLHISAEKYRDLISMLPNIMPRFRQFYEDLDHDE